MNAYPTVKRDDASAGFFDAARRKQLQMVRSPSGVILGPQAIIDPDDPLAVLEPVIVSGEGTLVSWVVVHKAPRPALADSVPYISALVELTEGPWLIVRLIGTTEHLTAGMKVRVRYEPTGSDEDPGEVVPVFEPVEVSAE
ncbi:hypothetical protein BST36_14695 [Mycolicibacterium moriokaense]|uniref:ChsH2 C-terminal OB-fold domain-containing protein n=1 Tax=Mycolicibacterium moriokaense TaxID=39691 RepID=A0AAD1H6Z6_9MYCO|nr:OB-fold domain-containing protein [Mycolicibacterium moriokaense]MCV7037859.1 OB-fold domain-containing protein [Mycolicibacterium moriokaense]ORB22165.1 hypothetical protein BST36_14695 [Mycolicibacterium moriokaense]BBW99198.1 hypothetical protein MMOR_01350 [Mycolicibacterium moriokaense]